MDELTRAKADKLLAAVELLPEASGMGDPLVELGSDGESEDREDDTQDVQDALLDFLDAVASLRRAAEAVGLSVVQPTPKPRRG